MPLLRRQNRRGYAKTSEAVEVDHRQVAAMLATSRGVACRLLSTTSELKLVWTTCGDYKLVVPSDRLVVDSGLEVVSVLAGPCLVPVPEVAVAQATLVLARLATRRGRTLRPLRTKRRKMRRARMLLGKHTLPPLR